MRAAVVNKFGEPVSIEDVYIEPPQKGEVKVRVAAAGICHSDIHGIQGEHGYSELPAIFGHEVAGIVEEIGEGVTYVNPGDAVMISLMRAGCGTCYYCTQGNPSICEIKGIKKALPNQPTLAGPSRCLNKEGKRLWQLTGSYAGFAEYTIVEEDHLVKLDKDIPMDVAAIISCAVISGFYGVVNRGQVRPFDSVVVIGAGGVGLSAVQGAAFSGAFPIIAVDIFNNKLDAAREFGATHIINAKSSDPIQVVKDITNGRGADHVFVTVAGVQLKRQGYLMSSKRGEIVVIGHSGLEYLSDFEVRDIMGGRKLTGSAMGAVNLRLDIPRLIDIYKAGILQLDKYIANRYSLDQINDAIASTESGNALRNVIIF